MQATHHKVLIGQQDMTQQLDFLRFTDYKANPFELEDFYYFLSNFDCCEPDFLAWIEHNKAPYVYFDFYVLLVKNFLNQQKNIAEILAFILRKDFNHQGSFIDLIKKSQQKNPDILDLTLFENALIEHLKQQDISSYFTDFKTLFDACCLFYFRFTSIPTYLCQHISATNGLLIDSLIQCGHWQDFNHGILEQLIAFTQQGYIYNIYSDFKYWAEKTQHTKVKEKISLIAQLILQNALKESAPYSVHSYIANQTCNKAVSIEGYIDLLQHFPNPQAKSLLNQLIENTSLHLAIRFEATLIYFLSYQQQHPLKSQLTEQLLTLPLSQRWGKSSIYHGIVNSSELFKHTDFFSLDEILLALNNTQWCYSACECFYQCLYDYKKANANEQQLIIAKTIESIASMIQQMLRVDTNSYIDAQFIGYLSKILKKHDNLSSQQRQQLEYILLDGLKAFFVRFPQQKHLHSGIIETIYSLGFAIPNEYFDLLSAWTKLSFAWQAKNLNPETIWQQLIDAQAVAADTEFDAQDDFLNYFLTHNNHVSHGENSDETLHEFLFEQYFNSRVEWLDEDDLEDILPENIIHINQVNPDLEWKNINYFTFKNNDQYYRFFIYDYWDNEPSFLAIFNHILKRFGSNKAVYSLGEMDDYYGGDSVYFSADAVKFDQLNQILNIPCIPSTFFIPEAKSPAFLKIESEYKLIIQQGSFLSSLTQSFVSIPKPQSLVSKDAEQWLASMDNEMRSRASSFLSHQDFLQQALNVRNLFISIALNLIYDLCVANELKKKFPLKQTDSYTTQNLTHSQLLSLIFDQQDIISHLKYPYS